MEGDDADVAFAVGVARASAGDKVDGADAEDAEVVEAVACSGLEVELLVASFPEGGAVLGVVEVAGVQHPFPAALCRVVQPSGCAPFPLSPPRSWVFFFSSGPEVVLYDLYSFTRIQHPPGLRGASGLLSSECEGHLHAGGGAEYGVREAFAVSSSAGIVQAAGSEGCGGDRP